MYSQRKEKSLVRKPILASTAYLVYPLGLALNGVVYSTCTCRTPMAWHVHTNNMHILWEEL